MKKLCHACTECQLTTFKDKPPKASIQLTYQHVRSKKWLDTVGPLKTMSTGGNRYILTVVDLRTPWPEAVML